MKKIMLIWLLMIIPGQVFAGRRLIRDAAFLTSFWTMLRPDSSVTGDKEKEYYQSYYLIINTREWKRFSLGLSLPVTFVQQTRADGTQLYRWGLSDLEIEPRLKWKFITGSMGLHLPLGYGYDVDGPENLWLGAGSPALEPVISFNGYYKPLKMGTGLELNYCRYLTDGMAAWGSWQQGAKAYATTFFKRAGFGIVLESVYKSISYYTTGTLKTTGLTGKGYGEPYNQYELSGGLFLLRPVGPTVEILGGVNTTILTWNAGPGLGLWLQTRWKFSP